MHEVVNTIENNAPPKNNIKKKKNCENTYRLENNVVPKCNNQIVYKLRIRYKNIDFRNKDL